MQVLKRNGTIEDFSSEKLSNAIKKALERTSGLADVEVDLIVESLSERLTRADKVSSVQLMNLVELELMTKGFYGLAREFILYREQHKPDIFRKRVNYKPIEYPSLVAYGEAIHNSFWLHTHYNYMSDIQDMKVNMPAHEVQVAQRSMLAISQIEVGVKRFWAKIGEWFPKPEIEEVGSIFADSEVRHAKAYSHLIEIMGLNEEFLSIRDVPVIKKRIDYLERSIATPIDNQDYFKNIILFSLLIENVSLFSQFYILKTYYKKEQWLSGIDNAITATSKEEDLHAQFGVELVKTIKRENPEWWTDQLVRDIVKMAEEAKEAEYAIVDWIFENVEESLVDKDEVKDFISYRLNKSLQDLGIPSLYVGMESTFEWFELELKVTKGFDFFKQKGTAYSKGVQSFDGELF
jgi:ribonucleoside-diphosphate reductase beta chain